MAGPTRLELATSGVTGRRSNQLNYDPAKGTDAASRPCVTREAAWPKPRITDSGPRRGLVGGTGLEPVAAGV